ncbi:hypothetical protein [Sphingomonas sp. BK345]|uniref:hypothetical protein n=1 Tax=Sphingomonas sp. BK345 TaxID=2586980 RepID=UPI00161414BE|nr:hypothetical protein [Sphingomonas sp. BK345]MBB3475581.1 hypothetical protein [Sphingomonas sp. BK345]
MSDWEKLRKKTRKDWGSWQTWALVGLLLLNAISYYGGLRQGISQMQADLQAARAAFQEQQRAQNYLLAYRNINNRVGVDKESGKEFFQLLPIIHNPNDVTLYARVVKSESSLGGVRGEPFEGVIDTVTIYPGLDTNLFDAVIYRSLPKTGQLHGRVDAVIRYGTSKDNLNRVLRIKGAIGVELAGQRERLFFWAPDDDSAKPIGMKNAKVDYVPGEETPFEALSNQLTKEMYSKP